jgi:hypothetical protein
VARRDSALKGGAWVLVVAFIGGFGFLAQRVFFKAKSDLSQPAPEPVPAELAPPPTAEERLKKCEDAVELAPAKGWFDATSACEEAVRFLPEPQAPAGPPVEGDASSARSLARHARTQLECEQAINKALKFIDGGQVEEAGFALGGVAPGCALRRTADELTASLKPELIRVAAAQCEKRAEEGRWNGTFDACERYVELKYCPGPLKELEVPKGKYLDLYASASGKEKGRGWRPEDPLLVHFLAAKQAAHSQRGAWRCTTHFEPVKPLVHPMFIIRGSNAADDAVTPVKRKVKKPAAK